MTTLFRGCEHCGNYVPVCPDCDKRLPHGNVGGTYLACDCGWEPTPGDEEVYEGE